ncbi:hypothetical protein [Virgibacillus salexigens]|nr:hypothetical protein [Virgibacillus massiliensis]
MIVQIPKLKENLGGYRVHRSKIHDSYKQPLETGDANFTEYEVATVVN